MGISFFKENIRFTVDKPRKITSWLKKVAQTEGREISSLNIIFCSDTYLFKINKQYLNHSYFTDIVTFDLSEASAVQGDIFISIHRVKENAENLKIPFETELYRVIVHGLLHLLGYSDHTPPKKKQMRKKEDAYLSLL